MDTVRTAFVAATAILAMLALAATAHAQTVQIVDEATGQPCPAITGTGAEATGGCAVHGSGEVEMISHAFGIEATISDCVIEGTGIVGPDGEGWVQQGTTTDHAGQNDCEHEACPEAGHDMEAWPVHVREETPGELSGQTEYCFGREDGSGGNTRCLITRSIAESASHTWHEAVVDLAGTTHEGGACEMTGEGTLEGGIEVVH